MNRSQVRVVDPVLSKVAQGYRNARFIGQTLMPIIGCPKSGVQLIKFGKEAFIKYAMRRAPGSKVARVQYGYGAEPVSLVQDALEGVVPREWLRDSADIPNVNLGTRAINNVLNSVHLGLEIEIASIACDASNYDADHKIAVAGADKWTDGGSKLSLQMQQYKEAVRATTGAEPNVLTLTPGDFNACKVHPEVVERFKYTSAESITTDMLAAFFELDTVEVGKAIWTPDESRPFQDVWTQSVLAYVPHEGERSMDVPSYGYTYVLDEHPLVEEAYYDKSVKSWIYPVEYERRPYMTGMGAGFLIQNAS